MSLRAAGSGYNPASVAITGGTIDGTTIGGVTPGAITGTTIMANAALNVASATVARTSAQNLGAPYILAQSAVPVSAPADTTEDTLYTCTVPANAIGPNGSIRISFATSVTGSANIKTIRIRFSGASGTIVYAVASSSLTDTDISGMAFIANRNATNSQVGGSIAFPAYTNGGSVTTTTRATSAVDTTASTTIVITGQKATAGETLTLERVLIELAYGA